jgi:hypothetical protein
MAQSFSLCMVGMEAIVVKWLDHVEMVDLQGGFASGALIAFNQSK